MEQYPSLHLDDVYLVLAYYLDNRAAVDAYVARRDAEAKRLCKKNEADVGPTGLRARLLARQDGGS